MTSPSLPPPGSLNLVRTLSEFLSWVLLSIKTIQICSQSQSTDNAKLRILLVLHRHCATGSFPNSQTLSIRTKVKKTTTTKIGAPTNTALPPRQPLLLNSPATSRTV